MNNALGAVDTIIQNREWIFSGIGVFILGGFFTWIRSSTWLRRDDAAPMELVLQPQAKDPNTPPFLFMLPNGETIDPFEIEKITLSGSSLYNVCYVVGGNKSTFSKSFFHTYSRRKALQVARDVTEALNRARGYR